MLEFEETVVKGADYDTIWELYRGAVREVFGRVGLAGGRWMAGSEVGI
jgi:hypothetical protein